MDKLDEVKIDGRLVNNREIINLRFYSFIFKNKFVLLSRTCIGLGLKVALEDVQLLNNNQVFETTMWNLEYIFRRKIEKYSGRHHNRPH